MTEKREIPFGRPWITDQDKEAVLRVLGGHILTHGPECKAFEVEFAAVMGAGAHCVSMSSCMAALHMSYVYLGVKAGDEVIVPALTHVATVHAVEWVGARPVCVDCDPATGNVTADRIAAAITPRTKAISLVHFAGIPADMSAIMAVAEQHRLPVVEDCAIAIGARWKGTHVGLFGDMGCFSFYPVKHITTGEGGMFASRKREIVDAVAKLRAFGVDRTHTERAIPGMYEVPSLGLNYRMSEIQAALGRTQIARIDQNLRERRTNFEALRKGLGPLDGNGLRVLDAQSPDAQNSHYCLIVVLDEKLGASRNDVIAKLNAMGVGTSVYYPQPVPRMKYYRNKYGYDAAQFPNTAAISDRSIALPVGHHIGPDDTAFIARAMATAIKELT